MPANDATVLAPSYDVVVVGARVAGAATGMLLARAGLRVLVVDRARPGTDTCSTHALMRPAVDQLDRWGLLDRLVAGGTPGHDTFVFRYDDVEVPVVARRRLYAPRRTVLDPLLVDAAREAGATVAFGVDVVDLLRTADGGVTGVVVRHRDGRRRAVTAGLVVGADGRGSRVAAAVDAPVTHHGSTASAVVYGYVRGVELDRFDWAFTSGAAAGVFPTDDGLACVFTASAATSFRALVADGTRGALDRLLRRTSPVLADLVAGGRFEGPVRGFPGVPSRLRRPFGPGWALVGDAGYWKDPATGHGISDAFRDAELLSEAVVRGREHGDLLGALRGYELLRDELSLPLLAITDRIASHACTVDELQRLHRRLSQVVQHEAEALAGTAAPLAVAA